MNLDLFAVGPIGWGDELLWGLWLTIRLGVAAITIGTVLGLLSAICELRSPRWLGHMLELYNAAMRSVPELLVIFVIYYGASFALQAALAPFGFTEFIDIGGFWAGTAALAIIHAAYANEAFRGGFMAIPRGQIDAGRAFGMGSTLLFFRIELPLAIRLAIAGLTNLVMATLKSTPLVSAIGLQDLIRAANDAGQNTKYYFQFYMASLAIYLLISAVALLVQTRTESNLFRHMQLGAGRK